MYLVREPKVLWCASDDEVPIEDQPLRQLMLLPTSPITKTQRYEDEDTEALRTDKSAPTPPVPSPRLRKARISGPTPDTDDVSRAEVPPRKRLLFECLSLISLSWGRSSSVTAARQPRLDVTHATDYSLDAQDDRALQRARVNTLFRDRRYHLHTTMLLESEARYARQAWSQAMDCNRAVHVELLAYRAEVRALHEQISVQQGRFQ
ncbi:hypothetical protein Tco_0773639 [Tanacetum coccineum]|uniref:Uncharacterized protein n=1 Tax=Tanacetum coccineum TaxID=301880 RepID=A0ABQ4ZLA7_9ASTR